MSKTARGIYKNLKESEYTVTVNGTVYFFSSILYMTKFERELKDNRKRLKVLMEQQHIDFLYTDDLADYRLYKKIEKRGFCIAEPHDKEKYDFYTEFIWQEELSYRINTSFVDDEKFLNYYS